MKQIRQRLTYANVMSSIAVFFILGGATAFAATKIGANELKANAVLTGKIKKEAVVSGKIKNNAIITSKIADKAVTGAKIDVTTVGKVPTAVKADTATNAETVGGLTPAKFSVAGSGYGSSSCDPGSTAFQVCTSVALNLPHAGQVVLVGAGGFNAFAAAAEGTCEFSVDGVLNATPQIKPGQTTDISSSSALAALAITTVTASLPAGNHTFALACNQRTGDMEYIDTTISAQLVG